MDDASNLSHSKWECKYHVVFIPKCRRKTLYEQLRRHLGEVFRRLAAQKEGRIEEGHLMPDHVHMMISIPPRYAVSQVVGYIKGKSAASGAGVWRASAQFRRPALLGTRVLRVHGGAGRGGDQCVHPEPGEGGPPYGSSQPVELMGHL